MLQALLQSLDDLYPSQNCQVQHDLVMTSFSGDGGDSCVQCGRRFLGLLARGYRCRRCGAVLHKKCISERACLDKENR